jgi:hypothetical protein
MPFLNLFKSSKAHVHRLAAGCFTVDAEGRMLTSTLPHGFPEAHIEGIAREVLAIFRTAQKAQLKLSELVIHYAALKLTVRELRGGAIVFVVPHASTDR